MSPPASPSVSETAAGQIGSAPDAVDGVRVRTHPGLCVGIGNCHRWAPEVYPLDDDGHVGVHLLAVPPELAEQAWRGATVCPEQAITVIGPTEEYWIERRDELSGEHR
jgi:ferredoxin